MSVEFGDDNPDAAEHIRRQLATIEVILDLAAEVRFPPEPGSDVEVLVERIGPAPVFIGRGIQAYLRTSAECLIHIRQLLDGGGVSTVVLQALLRPALIASGRVVFVLESDDRDVQLEHALVVLRQECGSYLSALKSFSEFQYLLGLRPLREAVASAEAVTSAVRSRAPHRGEGQVLDDMAELVSAAVAKRPENDVEAGVMEEGVKLAWHMFSGGAHGYVWPDNIPVDLISLLGFVVPVAHWAMDLSVRRTRQ